MDEEEELAGLIVDEEEEEEEPTAPSGGGASPPPAPPAPPPEADDEERLRREGGTAQELTLPEMRFTPGEEVEITGEPTVSRRTILPERQIQGDLPGRSALSRFGDWLRGREGEPGALERAGRAVLPEGVQQAYRAADDYLRTHIRPQEAALGQGFLQSGGLGMGDELSAGVDAFFGGIPFREARDRSRASARAAEEHFPVEMGQGELLGMAGHMYALGGGPAAAEASEAARFLGPQRTALQALARMALPGAAYGAVQAFGESEEEDPEALAQETSEGALLGGAAGPAIDAGLRGGANLLGRAGRALAPRVESLGAGVQEAADEARLASAGYDTAQELRRVRNPAQRAESLRETGISRGPIASPRTAATRARALEEEAAALEAPITEEVERRAGILRTREVAAEIDRLIEEQTRAGVGGDVRAALRRFRADLMSNARNGISWRELNQMRSEWRRASPDQIRSGRFSALAESGEDIYRALRNAQRRHLEDFMPELVEPWEGVMRRYAIASPTRAAAQRSTSRGGGRSALSIYDLMAAGAGGGFGHAEGGGLGALAGAAGTAAAIRVARDPGVRAFAGERAALSLRNVASVLRDPEIARRFFGDNAQALLAAQRRGPTALMAVHRFLIQGEPEYRSQLDELDSLILEEEEEPDNE